MAHGLQIFDASGNIMLDTSDNTIKDLTLYTNNSVTSNGNITGISGLNATSIVLVSNNNGDNGTELPDVEIDYNNNTIKVLNGVVGFNASLRVVDL